MVALTLIFVLVIYGSQWQYDVDAAEYKYVIDKCWSVIHMEPNCTFNQLVSSLYNKFNVSSAEKSVMLKYKLK